MHNLRNTWKESLCFSSPYRQNCKTTILMPFQFYVIRLNSRLPSLSSCVLCTAIKDSQTHFVCVCACKTRDDFTLINQSLARQDRTRGFVCTAAHPSLKSIEEQADQSASSVGRLTQGDILREKLLFSFVLQPPIGLCPGDTTPRNDQYVSMSKLPVRPINATSHFHHYVCLYLKQWVLREKASFFWATSKQLYNTAKDDGELQPPSLSLTLCCMQT